MELIVVRDIAKKWCDRLASLKASLKSGEMRPAQVIDELNSISIESAALKRQLAITPLKSKEENEEVVGILLGFCVKTTLVASEIYKMQRHGTEV